MSYSYGTVWCSDVVRSANWSRTMCVTGHSSVTCLCLQHTYAAATTIAWLFTQYLWLLTKEKAAGHKGIRSLDYIIKSPPLENLTVCLLHKFSSKYHIILKLRKEIEQPIHNVTVWITSPEVVSSPEPGEFCSIRIQRLKPNATTASLPVSCPLSSSMLPRRRSHCPSRAWQRALSFSDALQENKGINS